MKRIVLALITTLGLAAAMGAPLPALASGNDSFASATSITGALPLTFNDTGNTNSATSELALDPSWVSCGHLTAGGPQQFFHTVWWTYTPAVNSTMTISTEGSASDTLVGVVEGSAAPLTQDKCDDDSGPGNAALITGLPLTAGHEYHIELMNTRADVSGAYAIEVDVDPIPANDSISSPVAITNLTAPFTQTLQISGLTATDLADPAMCNGLADPHRTVWYTFTTNTTGVLNVDTLQSDYDTDLAIYSTTGAAPDSNAAYAACNDDVTSGIHQSAKQLAVDTTHTYYIGVAAFPADTISGTLVLNVTFGAPGNQAPYKPGVPTPANNSFDLVPNPTSMSVSWVDSDPDNDALTYSVVFDQNPTPVTALAGCTAVSTASCALTMPLAQNSTYYWQVTADDAHSHTTTGPIWSFTTGPTDAAPDTPSAPTPANNATGVALSSTLLWTSHDADNTPIDTVLFGTSGTLADPADRLCKDHVPANQCPTGSLAPHTTYHWQVLSSDGTLTTNGPVWAFTTLNNAPSAPGLTAPTSGATGVSTTPTLTWTASTDADGDTLHYSVFLDTTTGTTPVGSCTDITALSCPISTALNRGTTYHWKVSATDGFDITSSSDTFTTVVNAVPSAPGLTAPADAATGVSTAPTLTWSASTDADGDTLHYAVFLDTTTGTTPVASCANLTTLTCPVTGLNRNTTYHWKVTASDGFGGSTSSTAFTFTTAANTAPDAPSAPSPANNALNVGLTPTLTWTQTDPDGDPLTYTVKFGTTNPPTNTLTCASPTAASCDAGSLAFNVAYFWQVSATDGTATTNGPVFKFTTGPGQSALVAPTPRKPKNGVAVFTPKVILSWKTVKNAKSYYVELFNNNDMSLAHRIQTGNPTKTTFTTMALNYGMYFWHVMAKDKNLTLSKASALFSFEVTLNKVPKKNAMVTSSTGLVHFTWKAPAGKGHKYVLKVCSDATCTTPVTGFPTAQLSKTSYTMPKGSTPLHHKTQYWWQVIVDGTPSTIWMFTLK